MIFDVQDGKVYEYQFVYRSAIKFYDDNVILGSSGAAYNTFYKVSFDKGTVNQDIVAESKEVWNDDSNVMVYTLWGKEVTEDEYYEFINTYESIIEVQWNEGNLSDVIVK